MKDSALARKLIWIVLVKLAILFVLWWLFIRDQRVEVSPATMTQRMQQPTQGASPNGQ
jgi:hypothetical protein